jgi:hypothetical protein
MGKGIGVALFCHVKDYTVLPWIKCYHSEGIDGLADGPRCGDPDVLPRMR